MENKIYFEVPKQVIFADPDAESIAWLVGIAYKDEVICADCGSVFEIEDIVSAAAFAGAEVIQVGVCMNAGRAKDNAELLLTENEWQLIKEKIKKLSLSRAVVFCEEFECKCMTDSQFNCPAADNSFGVISPNGIYRKCLHYYEKNI